MSVVSAGLQIAERAPIPTWLGVGGVADRLCRPRDVAEVSACVRAHGDIRVLGDGANLLVDDDGVGGLVIDTAGLDEVEIDDRTGLVRAGAGVNLPKLITRCARVGLGGLEVLAGIPASVGGAAVMNAGGRFGAIADTIHAVEIVREDGALERVERGAIAYGYRASGLAGVVVGVEFGLEPGDPVAIRDRLKSCMAYKKNSQPMAADSAGCCFKNPLLAEPIDGIGEEGSRVSAGMLIDRAGCKGLRSGGAVVSGEHANFLVTEQGACAGDVIRLMDKVVVRVRDTFGVELEREVVVWRRGCEEQREGSR